MPPNPALASYSASLVCSRKLLASSSVARLHHRSLTYIYRPLPPKSFVSPIPLSSHQNKSTTPREILLRIVNSHNHTKINLHITTKMSGYNDGGMTNGVFNVNNTVAPKGTDRVLSLFSLKGRTAIVSGAGAGIGLAVAHALAEAGANVAIWYNSNKKAIDEAKNIEKEYGVKCALPHSVLPSRGGFSFWKRMLIYYRPRIPSKHHLRLRSR